jgi:hypothetical protein
MSIIGRGATGLSFGTGSLIVGISGETAELPVGEAGQVLTVIDQYGTLGWSHINQLPNQGNFTRLVDLYDVEPNAITPADAGKPLVINSAGNAVGFGGLYLRALEDVDDNMSPSTGQVLLFNGTYWTAGNATGGASILNDLTDVTISSPAAGHILQFNGTEWVNSSVIDGGTF